VNERPCEQASEGRRPLAISCLAEFPGAVAAAHPGLGVGLLSGRAPVDLAKGEAFAPPGATAVRVDSIDLARCMIAGGAGIGVLYCVAGDADAGLSGRRT
jgi:hypothetical protein